jgi:hypothetical protein
MRASDSEGSRVSDDLRDVSLPPWPAPKTAGTAAGRDGSGAALQELWNGADERSAEFPRLDPGWLRLPDGAPQVRFFIGGFVGCGMSVGGIGVDPRNGQRGANDSSLDRALPENRGGGE